MRYSEMIAREKQRVARPAPSASDKKETHSLLQVAIWLAAAAVLLYWAL